MGAYGLGTGLLYSWFDASPVVGSGSLIVNYHAQGFIHGSALEDRVSWCTLLRDGARDIVGADDANSRFKT
jgi:hypothetical protein